MSYRMFMAIERDKQLKAIARYRKANVNSVEEAEKLEDRYWKQYNDNGGEKNRRLGAKLIHGKAKRWVEIPEECQD
jgi:hypothetical protein